MSTYNLQLISNQFRANTAQKFTCSFPKYFQLNGDYEMAIRSLSIPGKFHNMTEDMGICEIIKDMQNPAPNLVPENIFNKIFPNLGDKGDTNIVEIEQISPDLDEEIEAFFKRLYAKLMHYNLMKIHKDDYIEFALDHGPMRVIWNTEAQLWASVDSFNDSIKPFLNHKASHKYKKFKRKRGAKRKIKHISPIAIIIALDTTPNKEQKREKVAFLKSGLYETFESMSNEYLSFTLNKNNSKLTITPLEAEGRQYIKLSDKLSDLLGIKRGFNITPIIANNISNETLKNQDPQILYIYCNICDYNIINDHYGRLLAVIPLGTQNERGFSLHYDNPLWAPISAKFFNELELEIRTSTDLPAPFHTGITALNLQIRSTQKI